MWELGGRIAAATGKPRLTQGSIKSYVGLGLRISNPQLNKKYLI